MFPQAMLDILLDLEPGFLAAFPKIQKGFAAFSENAEVKKFLGPNVPAYLQRQ